MEKPPLWIRDLLAAKPSKALGRYVVPSYHAAIEDWLRMFTKAEPNLEPLGGGHFGYAYRIWAGTTPQREPSEFGGGEKTGLVFKITRDPTEGPFCQWIHEEQEKGNSLFQGAFARVYGVRKIPENIPWRGKDWPCYLIVREEVDVAHPHSPHLADYPSWAKAADALRVLQVAGRQLAKPRKRGVATVTEAVHRGGVYLGEVTRDARQVWEKALGVLELDQRFYYVWEAFWQIQSEYGIYLQDVHANNIGRRIAMPGDDWSGAEGTFVIFDPGHTATGDRAGEITLLRATNPPQTVTYDDIHYEGTPWAVVAPRMKVIVGTSGDTHSGSDFYIKTLEAAGKEVPAIFSRDDATYDHHVLTGRWHPGTRTLAFWRPEKEPLFWKHADRVARALGIRSLEDVQIAVLGGDPSSESPIRYMNGRPVPLLGRKGNPEMTEAQALAEARRRWGADGRVRTQRLSATLRDRVVGVVRYGTSRAMGKTFFQRGRGPTWEAAFAAADARGRS